MEKYLIKPNKKFSISDISPSDKSQWDGDKDDALQEFHRIRSEIDRLQDMLYAEHKHKLLIIIQAMDTAGKDGTIHSVFEGINPQGVKVYGFKAPTQPELDHDYLWRVHSQAPGKGEIVVFNRSHYEDVLVVRVHKLVPENTWKKRYQHINDFERMLVDEGATIIKFYLHIDLEEQKKRLLERIDTPEKRWKFNPGDLEERKLWNDYMQAYEDVLNQTSTEWAPWYIIPSNRNWYRNLMVAKVILNALNDFHMHYPEPVEDITKYRNQF